MNNGIKNSPSVPIAFRGILLTIRKHHTTHTQVLSLSVKLKNLTNILIFLLSLFEISLGKVLYNNSRIILLEEYVLDVNAFKLLKEDFILKNQYLL